MSGDLQTIKLPRNAEQAFQVQSCQIEALEAKKLEDPDYKYRLLMKFCKANRRVAGSAGGMGESHSVSGGVIESQGGPKAVGMAWASLCRAKLAKTASICAAGTGGGCLHGNPPSMMKTRTSRTAGMAMQASARVMHHLAHI